jgi:S-adenosylmethionine:diacylglycerol 3-amino-3-carboxypropyl transferase
VPDADLEEILRDYRAAFLRSLPRHNEAALAIGYDLGRRAVTDRVSLLDLVQVHHVVLAEVLTQSPASDTEQVLEAASTFLVEVLSTFDMTQRMRENRTPGV